MTLLVTGASGFVGLNITEKFLSEGHKVVMLDTSTTPPKDAVAALANLAGDYVYVQGDVLEGKFVRSVLQDHDITHVIHAAAITPNDERERQDAKRVMQVNLMGTLEVIEASLDHGVKRLVYPSSASVYGDNSYDHELLDEVDTIPLPRATYAISKYAAERYVLRARELWGLDAVVARVGAVFGPWEHDTGVRDTLSGPMLASRLAVLNQEAVLPRPGPKDWVYSRDVAKAFFHLLRNADLNYQLYNVSGGHRWTVEDWSQKLSKKFPDFTYRFADDSLNVTFGSRDRSPLSVERLTSDIMTPSFGLDAAFSDYMTWIDEHSDFWLGS